MSLKRILGGLFAFFVMAAFSLTAVAQEKAKTEGTKMEETKTAKKAAPKTSRVSGSVKSVDATGKMLTVTTKAKKDVMISVNEKTKIKSGKEDKKLEDLKEGDRVNVTGTPSEGPMMAKTVTLMPPAKAKTETMEKAPAKPMGEEKKGSK